MRPLLAPAQRSNRHKGQFCRRSRKGSAAALAPLYTIRKTALGTLLLFLLSANQAPAQNLFPTIADPDAIAGVWQTPDSHSGAIGINIELTTAIDGLPITFTGTSQRILSVQIEAFHSATPAPERGDFFLASGTPDWNGHQLQVHFEGDRGRWPNRPPVNLDLLWQPQTHTWTGPFQIGSFRQQVTLIRPAAYSRKSPFTGTWAKDQNLSCLHLMEVAAGRFVAWQDALQLTGLQRRRTGIPAPPYAPQHYGEIVLATQPAPGQITVNLHPCMPYTGGVAGIPCGETFTAKLSPDKQALLESWRAGPNATPAAVWQKLPNNSCTSSPHPIRR